MVCNSWLENRVDLLLILSAKFLLLKESQLSMKAVNFVSEKRKQVRGLIGNGEGNAMYIARLYNDTQVRTEAWLTSRRKFLETRMPDDSHSD